MSGGGGVWMVSGSIRQGSAAFSDDNVLRGFQRLAGEQYDSVGNMSVSTVFFTGIVDCRTGFPDLRRKQDRQACILVAMAASGYLLRLGLAEVGPHVRLAHDGYLVSASPRPESCRLERVLSLLYVARAHDCTDDFFLVRYLNRDAAHGKTRVRLSLCSPCFGEEKAFSR